MATVCPLRPSRLAVLLAALAAACGPGPTALHDLSLLQPGADPPDFYALPFPSDLRLRPDGSYDISAYPKAPGQIGRYIATMDGRVPGAGPGAAIYFRFGGPLDPATLPQSAAESLTPGATAYVVDIDPASPAYGQRSPVLATFHGDAGRFIGPNWLALLPLPGFPLRPRTRYAAVLTAGLRGPDGGRVEPAADFMRLLAAQPPADAPGRAAWQIYAPLRDYVQRGFHPRDAGPMVAATVFTTQDPTTLMLRLREATYRFPAPQLQDLRWVRDHDGLCHLYHAAYVSPDFQEGQVPYLYQGGAIHIGTGGVPEPVRSEVLRLAISVPNAPMPAAGWPVILYAHGTGGNYESFIREELDVRAAHIEMPDGSVVGVAMLGIDQVLHGPRDPTGSPVDLTFFNLENLIAARDNPKQGAADDFQLLRLARAVDVAAAPVTGQPIRFDERHIYFLGHSQGGLTGPLFLGAEPWVRAAVLSGAGAGLVLSLLNKALPVDIGALVSGILQEPAVPEHPLLNLLQAYFESSDPGNYGRLFFREPLPGYPPKSIFQTMGFTDHYTPDPNIQALALAMGVQPATPQIQPIPDLALSGLGWATGAVAKNVAGGAATGALRQYMQEADSDGHFVIYDRGPAHYDWTHFLASDIVSGTAQLPAYPDIP